MNPGFDFYFPIGPYFFLDIGVYIWYNISMEKTEETGLALKRLKPKHRLVLRLWSVGISQTDIAIEMNAALSWVNQVINCEAGKAFLAILELHLNAYYKQLRHKGLAVVAKNMDNIDPRVQLSAVALYNQMVPDTGTAALTAEDVVGRLCEEEQAELTALKDETAKGKLLPFERKTDAAG